MVIALDELHRLTVEDYLALAEVSDLERTELIDGVIYDVTPESMGHTDPVEDIFHRLVAIVGRRAHMAGSIRISDVSMWDPDVWVEREGSDRSTGYVSAADVELVVEVSRTTTSRDLGAKLHGYAAARIPAYWIIFPSVGSALVRTEPENGVYLHTQRIELPNGYKDLPVEDLWAS